MEQHKLLDSLCTSVERLKQLSPELKHLEASVLNGPGVPIHQWQGILELFFGAIDRVIDEIKLPSDGDVWVADVKVWVADVKVLAADVEEILNEIAGTQAFEKPSKDCFPFFKGSKGKAVLTVNDDLRTKILRTSSQMATLNDRRGEIGLQVTVQLTALRVPSPPKQEQPPPAQEHEAQVEIPPVQPCNDPDGSSGQEKWQRLDEDSEGTIQGQLTNTMSLMSEPLSGTRRIKTDSNPEIRDLEDDIEIS